MLWEMLTEASKSTAHTRTSAVDRDGDSSRTGASRSNLTIHKAGMSITKKRAVYDKPVHGSFVFFSYHSIFKHCILFLSCLRFCTVCSLLISLCRISLCLRCLSHIGLLLSCRCLGCLSLCRICCRCLSYIRVRCRSWSLDRKAVIICDLDLLDQFFLFFDISFLLPAICCIIIEIILLGVLSETSFLLSVAVLSFLESSLTTYHTESVFMISSFSAPSSSLS